MYGSVTRIASTWPLRSAATMSCWGMGSQVTPLALRPSLCRTASVAIISMLYGTVRDCGIACGAGVAMVLPSSCAGLEMFELGLVITCTTPGAASYPSAISRSSDAWCGSFAWDSA